MFIRMNLCTNTICRSNGRWLTNEPNRRFTAGAVYSLSIPWMFIYTDMDLTSAQFASPMPKLHHGDHCRPFPAFSSTSTSNLPSPPSSGMVNVSFYSSDRLVATMNGTATTTRTVTRTSTTKLPPPRLPGMVNLVSVTPTDNTVSTTTATATLERFSHPYSHDLLAGYEAWGLVGDDSGLLLIDLEHQVQVWRCW